ncbi:cell division cycle 20.2, cofactor of APC complex-like [Dorcoceras hygrometricum]|uniref:Cell division cycle 20.2, cofactor of APC complex-like n=1 Tax=Dorcoceras hygrometricum TaxID=472368 RepID=A0A2Z7CXJ0_9LAMI|nr:cell division cycle 20.2, cofactor of APC complex-like [Dorcoceras hygrometricum]
MGIDQLGFQSVQLGYLKILKMGNTDPNNTKAGNRIRVYQPGKSPVRDLQARQPSQLDGFQTKLISWFTTPMIALYLSGMTHLSAGHNVALSQLLTARTKLKTARNTYPEAHMDRRTLHSTVARTHKLTASSHSLSDVDSGHLTGIN